MNGVQDGARRLAQHPLGQVAVVRQGAHPLGTGGYVLHQTARVYAPAGVNNNSLTLPVVLAAALHHHAGALMPWDTDAAGVMVFREQMAVFVADVAAADGNLLQLDKALPICRSGHFRIDYLKLPWGRPTWLPSFGACLRKEFLNYWETLSRDQESGNMFYAFGRIFRSGQPRYSPVAISCPPSPINGTGFPDKVP